MDGLKTFDRWFERVVILLGVVTFLHLTGLLPTGAPGPEPMTTPQPLNVPPDRWLLSGHVGEVRDMINPPMERAGRRVLRAVPAAPFWRKLVSLPDVALVAADEFYNDLASTTTNPDGGFILVVPLRPRYRLTATLGNRRAQCDRSLATGQIELIVP